MSCGVDEFGIVDEEERDGGIGDVRRADAAVGIALLGQEQQLPRPVLHELVRAHALPQRGAREQIVPLAHRVAVGAKLPVKARERGEHPLVFRPRVVHRADDGLSRAEVVPLEPFTEVEDGDLVVERRHEIPLPRAGEGEEVIPLALPAHILRLPRRKVDVEGGVGDEEALLARKVDVPPVGRGDVVRVGHDEVPHAGHERRLVALERQHAAHHARGFVVVAVLLVEGERHREVLGHLPLELRLVLRVAHGAGKQVEIVGRQGGYKLHFERKTLTRERILRAERRHGHVRLAHRAGAVAPSQKAVRLAVRPHETVGAAGEPRPEDGVAAVEFVAGRPDGKVRVDDPERISG